MEKERRRATEERLQRESVGLPIAPPAQAAAIESLTTSIATEPAPHPTPRMQPESAAPVDQSAGVPAVPTGRVPDDRINDAFAAIDREASDDAGTTAPAADQSARLAGSAHSVARLCWRIKNWWIGRW